MANTTNFGWETPDDTDLVKDGAAAMRTLGSAIDTSMMDLKGGTTDQVLAKNSNTDMDFKWVTSDDANAIQNSIVDAKGDIITATANDTPARLAIGTNNQVLMADSAQSTGLKYANEATATLTAKGDLLSATAANTLARLAVGTNNQVLMADSTQGTGLKYANGSTATLTAKGDLLSATAANTLARLPVGTNNQILTADSSTATGLKWAAASGSSFVGVSTYKVTTAQSIANDTEVNITFNAEEFDTDAFHDNSTNNSRLTVPSGKGGYYLLIANINFASNSTGNRFIGFKKNGTLIAKMNRFSASGTSNTFVGATAIVSAVATDYFECFAYQNSGGSLNVDAGQGDTRFACYFLGA